MHSFKSDEFKIRVLTKDDAEEYNALLRYAFQVTEADLARPVGRMMKSSSRSFRCLRELMCSVASIL